MRWITLLIGVGVCCTFALSQDCSEEKPCISPEKAGKLLASGRKDIRVARTVYRRLTSYEREALRESRKAIFTKTPEGKAMAPTFGAAADLLFLAAKMECGEGGKETKTSALMADMAESYRAMAKSVAGRDAYTAPDLKDTKALLDAQAAAKKSVDGALGLWKKGGEIKPTERKDIERDWRLLKKGDPRHRALAANLATLQEAFRTLDQQNAGRSTCTCNVHGLIAAYTKAAKQLTDISEAQFAGVKTKVWEAPPSIEIAPTPT